MKYINTFFNTALIKKILPLFIFTSLIISGCSGEDQLSNSKLKQLISDASSGSKSADDSLSGLFAKTVINQVPDEIIIDTISISGTKYFGAAVSFGDPLKNRFALYDQDLNCYLIDRSLNGYLHLSSTSRNNFNYFSLEERYFSKDSVELKRFSMYRGDSAGFTLAFRTFTMLKTRDTVFLHNLYEISPDIIRTNITAPVFSGLNNLNDDYSYDNNLRIYFVRRSIYFDDFVSDFVNSIPDTLHKFVKTSVPGKNDELSSAFETTEGSVPDYYLSTNENWRELRNKSGSEFLKKDLTGSKYVNDFLKSYIYVFRLPLNYNAEDYVNADLNNTVEGNYIVRYSDEYEFGGFIKKYFEYSCRTKKFLLILAAAENSYTDYKREYTDIINTFYINC